MARIIRIKAYPYALCEGDRMANDALLLKYVLCRVNKFLVYKCRSATGGGLSSETLVAKSVRSCSS